MVNVFPPPASVLSIDLTIKGTLRQALDNQVNRK